MRVSKPDKVLFPGDGVTKGDLAGQYRGVAEVMLPHLAGRPLTLRRFPDGIGGEGWFQKNASEHFPDWVTTVEVPQRDGGTVRHVVCDNADALVYLAGQAAVELHVWLSTVEDLEHPDLVVVDLDPPDGTGVGELRTVARRVRDLFTEVGLTPYVQASGGRGFHVAAPLTRDASFDEVREFARAAATRLAERDPDRLTTEIRKDKRGDRIFLDVNRNGYAQTFVAPYSVRARAGAPVATPLDWPELGRAEPAGYPVDRLRNRMARKADPWRDLREHAGSAHDAMRRL
ncbi:ATP-dependent DNA ligase [Amycolatopsis suaedae]|uniref:ATP-dependent DNA ligase n=1 Tax=Amycolatopsis suaedae TaxID=2510978 RepID=A0A4Q7J615_9PSEU|nr:non-homologous end-joining DNA ligase [Amycolatopsis suaedae]RZQ62182.1 ATP-dependent DNA ligase [Amycolatopsis suaedae]